MIKIKFMILFNACCTVIFILLTLDILSQIKMRQTVDLFNACQY